MKIKHNIFTQNHLTLTGETVTGTRDSNLLKIAGLLVNNFFGFILKNTIGTTILISDEDVHDSF